MDLERKINDTYTVSVFCNNCHAKSENIEIPKSHTVETTPCPNCGCRTLRVSPRSMV